MLVLGLQGSPRKKGNTQYLLKSFLNEAENLGARTHIIEVAKKNITPCKGCGFCEKKGYCVIEDDDMKPEIYPLLRSTDVIVVATPIFFYSVTAQLKALIDRSQALWSRKYKLKLTDPVKNYVDFQLGSEKHPITIHHLLTHGSGLPSFGFSEICKRPSRA